MLRDRVVFSGSSSLAHPVLDRLFGGALAPVESGKTADPNGATVVVIDARLSSNDLGDGGIAATALTAGVPLLILSPAEGQLDGLAAIVGAVPHTPMQAVFIAPNANRKEAGRYEATILAYPPGVSVGDAADHETPRDENDPVSGGSCGCGRSVQEHAADGVGDFAVIVEGRVSSHRFSPASLAIPDGLKYFQTTWNPAVLYFTTSGCYDDDCFTNGQGSFTVRTTVWGFLNQTATENSQYLIVEATYNLNPGTLAQNDDEGRGFLNTSLQSGLTPGASGFALHDHIPNNAANSWNESFTIDISYRDPLSGGYQIYQFETEIIQSIDSWSVQNATSGTTAGSMWYVNSPVNGTNILDTWEDAIVDAGHVAAFPSASTGTLMAKESTAWQTKTIYNGNVSVTANYRWDEDIIYATACGLLICYETHLRGFYRTWAPVMTVSFASIAP
jgi:hypothetical protein